MWAPAKTRNPGFSALLGRRHGRPDAPGIELSLVLQIVENGPTRSIARRQPVNHGKEPARQSRNCYPPPKFPYTGIRTFAVGDLKLRRELERPAKLSAWSTAPAAGLLI